MVAQMFESYRRGDRTARRTMIRSAGRHRPITSFVSISSRKNRLWRGAKPVEPDPATSHSHFSEDQFAFANSAKRTALE
jgi:hypothetical protein